jgi:hypothetical protein
MPEMSKIKNEICTCSDKFVQLVKKFFKNQPNFSKKLYNRAIDFLDKMF